MSPDVLAAIGEMADQFCVREQRIFFRVNRRVDTEFAATVTVKPELCGHADGMICVTRKSLKVLKQEDGGFTWIEWHRTLLNNTGTVSTFVFKLLKNAQTLIQSQRNCGSCRETCDAHRVMFRLETMARSKGRAVVDKYWFDVPRNLLAVYAPPIVFE